MNGDKGIQIVFMDGIISKIKDYGLIISIYLLINLTFKASYELTNAISEACGY